MAKLRWGATTDPGRVRTENEDTFVTEPMVFAVADGMGGHQAGEVASALAASIVRDRLGRGATSEDAAAAAVEEANAAIYGAAKANPAQTGMGTTLTALAVLTEADSDEERLVLLNVGDSRTYRFRAGRLQRVTVDHSYVQELVAAGHISIEEARTHPRRNIVTRALGIEPVVRADMWTLPIVRGDRYVLASDGLVDEVPDSEILDLVASIDDPQELSVQLVAIANRHGGRDNVTVVVVDVLEGSDPPDPTDEMQLDPAWAEGTEEPAEWADDNIGPPDAASTDGGTDPDEMIIATAGGSGPLTVHDTPTNEIPLVPPPPPPTDAELAPDPNSAELVAPPEPAMQPDAQPDAQPDVQPGEQANVQPGEQSNVGSTNVSNPEIDQLDTVAFKSHDDVPTEFDATAIRPTLPAAAAVPAAAAASAGMKIADSVAVSNVDLDSPAATGTASPERHRNRRRFSGGVFLFGFLIATILTVTFTLIAVHARSGYFIGFDDDTVVIYKGQRDGVLWFDPTVNARTTKTRDQLSTDVIALVESNEEFDSADDAAAFIETGVPTTVAIPETTTTTAPTTTTDATPAETTTTTAPTGG